MKLDKNEINNALASASVPYEARSALLSLALARVIAYGLPVPATADETMSSGMPAALCDQATKLVCEVNESFPVNIDNVVSMISKIWRFRYRLVHNPMNSVTVDHLDALLRAGASALQPADAELMTNYADDRALVNMLAQRLWDSTVFEPAPVEMAAPVEAAAGDVVASMECICPSMECGVHHGVVSAEGVKGAALGFVATVIPGLSTVSGAVMGHHIEEKSKEIDELKAKLHKSELDLRELRSQAHHGAH